MAETGTEKAAAVYTLRPPDNPRLRIVKVASTAFAEPGDEVDFTIRFDNVGDQTIHNVAILDSLSTRLEYIPDSAQCSRKAQFLQPAQRGRFAADPLPVDRSAEGRRGRRDPLPLPRAVRRHGGQRSGPWNELVAGPKPPANLRLRQRTRSSRPRRRRNPRALPRRTIRQMPRGGRRLKHPAHSSLETP